ncbi:hypothetical protein Pint_34012 [Pistacia integerrima]|uniref:Uncharacterized protein n=1 Tax=Pistacia integerrima TaxID=434235 RepID=A0ACC0X581_9ROSI|nr:hypothetical protein Pint_34012 [Pistacia integerrima]
MDKVIESEVTHPQMAGAKGSSCSMPACDGKAMKDERRADIVPCSKFAKIVTWMHKRKMGCVRVARSLTKLETMMMKFELFKWSTTIASPKRE